MALGTRPWESKVPIINNTGSRAAYRPYSTYVCRILRMRILQATDHWTGPSRNTKRGSRSQRIERAHKHQLFLSLGHRRCYIIDGLYRCMYEELGWFHIRKQNQIYQLQKWVSFDRSWQRIHIPPKRRLALCIPPSPNSCLLPEMIYPCGTQLSANLI
jgi:hypothetical protein